MKIKLVKSIRISEVGKTVLPKDFECEVSDECGKILVDRGYAKGDIKPPSAADSIEAIKLVKNLDDLKKYAEDDRATVKNAYDIKLTELTPKE